MYNGNPYDNGSPCDENFSKGHFQSFHYVLVVFTILLSLKELSSDFESLSNTIALALVVVSLSTIVFECNIFP